MANNNNDKNNKNGKNGTESILSRIASRAMKGMRRGANIPENQGILQTLAQRASSPTGQFYATLADPNAYYDKQGFGSAGTGMRSAQQAHQGAETARAAMQAKGIATPTSRLNSATSIHNKLQGELGIGVPVPHPLTGKMVDYNSLDKHMKAFYVKEFQARLMGMDDKQVDAMLKKQFATLHAKKEEYNKVRAAMTPEQKKEEDDSNNAIVAGYNKVVRFMDKTGDYLERDFDILMPALKKLMAATGEINVKKGLESLMEAIEGGATGIYDWVTGSQSAPVPNKGGGGLPPAASAQPPPGGGLPPAASAQRPNPFTPATNRRKLLQP